jgi:prepilin-type N-terminal cleavage/methylation domain-containing protein
MSASRQHGFTLAELLSVLVIIAIVLSIALPAVTNLTKANALNAAAREVSNTLSLARQYAITHRIKTRVVFPFSQTTVSSLAPAYLSYAVMTNNTSVDPRTNWMYVTKWEQLPIGAVFLNNTPQNGGALDRLPNDSLPFPAPGNYGTLAYIEFGPTGAATQTGTLTLQTGFIVSGGLNNGLPQLTAPYNSVTNVVDNIVGRIQVIHP